MSQSYEITAVLVDDEPLARDELAFLLEQCGGVCVLGTAANATEALALLDSDPPDLVFVDLRMPGPDGIALAEAIRAKHPDVQVVVVSAHDDGALRAFEARVLDYLLKPVRLERLRAALDRARERVKPKEDGTEDVSLDRLAVRRKGAYVVVDIADVVYFEVEDELVWAVTAEDRYALDLPLATLAKRLSDDDFFRSHRSVLVRLSRIKSIEPVGTGAYELVLDHPASPKIPLSRERVRSLRERIPFAG
jgi:two-component system response regulator LytT